MLMSNYFTLLRILGKGLLCLKSAPSGLVFDCPKQSSKFLLQKLHGLMES